MSDASYNLSNDTHLSPRHTPSVPSSPEPPASPTLAEISPPPTEGAIPFGLIADITGQSYPPVSPTSAETILTLDPTLYATIRTTTFGLATTVRQWTEQYSQRLAEAGLRIVELERLNDQHNADNRQLRARLGLLSVPDGFEHNEGRVVARVPSGGRGQMVVPTWIRPVGDGTVELLAGREPGEPTYVVELFLRPNYTENPTETAAPWFLGLLVSKDGGYHTLVEEVRHLNNPAATAEVYRYRALEEQRNSLTSELNRISDALASTRDKLDACRHRMEGGQLPTLMRHLEDRNTFTPRVTQLGRRRRNTARVRTVDDGASP